MRSKSYCIPINPIPWQRFGTNAKRFYDKQVDDKNSLSLLLLQQHDNDPLFEGPLRMDIVFYIKIPKNKERRKDRYHITTPTYDKFLKFLGDAMKNIVIVDDRFICAGSWSCEYDINPRYEFTIKELQ